MTGSSVARISSMPTMNSKLLRVALPAALFALVLFLAACGGSDDSDDGGGTTEAGPDPIALAPADVPFYMDVVVRPEGTLGDDLKSAVGKISGIEDPGAEIINDLNESLAEDTDLTYEDDIEPWLGSHAGLFVSGFQVDTQEPDAAGVLAVTDTDAAQSFIDDAAEQGDNELTDATYEDVDYKLDDETAVGIVGEYLVVGTEQGFKDAVDASKGDSLADNTDATAALDGAPDNSVFSVYADAAAIGDLIKASPELDPAQLDQIDQALAQLPDGPVEAWGTVTDSSFGIGGSSPTPEGAPAPSDLITTFPGDSWLAAASTDVGEQLDESIAQFQAGFQAGLEGSAGQLPKGFDTADIDPIAQIEEQTGLDLERDLGWIGDAGFFLEGTDLLGVGGGLVLESTDDAAAEDAIGKLQTALEKNPSVKQEAQIAPNQQGDGFTIQAPPFSAEVAVRDGKAIATGGSEDVDSVLSPDETLGDSERFTTATGNLSDGATATFFMDMPPLLQLIESQGQATDDPDYALAAPYLHAIDYLVAGSGEDGDRITASVVLGVKESDSEGGSDVAPAVITPVIP